MLPKSSQFLRWRPSLAALIALVAGAAWMWVAKKPAGMPEDAVAMVNGKPIPKALLELALGQGNDRGTRRAQEAMGQLIEMELAHQKAVEAKYHERPEVILATKRLLAGLYEREHLPEITWSDLSGDSLQSYYNANLSRYAAPEEYRIARLFIKVPGKASAEHRQAVRKKLETIRIEAERIPAQEGFGELSLSNSDETSTRYKGGDAGWLTKTDLVGRCEAKVAEEIVKLTPGGMTPVIETNEGYCVARLTALRTAAHKSFSEVKPAVLHHLKQEREAQRERAFDAELRAGARIVVNEKVIKALAAEPAPAPTPPGPMGR